MSAEFNFTDNQWYNFICGFHAGLKLKDMTLPPFDSIIVLHPIGVGGYGMIGIAIPEIEYTGNNNLKIPVFTHDVDIEYSGFSVNIMWDDTRLKFNGAVAGDFGTISDGTSASDIRYTYNEGNFKARGIRDRTVKFKEPVILFYLDVTVLEEPTANNPIRLKLISNSFSDLNYTTLLTWVEVAEGQWYNFFITPVKNVDGAIISDKLEENKQPMGDETVIAAPGSETGVYVGSAYTPPGNKGVVNIVSCSNKSDNFPYYGVHCQIVVEDTPDMFTYLNVVGTGGFTVDTTISTLDSGYILLDINATREESLIDAVTFCYIEYAIGNKDDSYVIPLNNILSELIG